MKQNNGVDREVAGKVFYSVSEIEEDLCLTEKEAREIVKRCHSHLKKLGKFVISGKVPAKFYERQRESGFIDLGSIPLPFSERRLLSIKEFSEYAGGMDLRVARKFVEKKRLCLHIGKKLYVDRKAFDEWCDTHKEGKEA